MAMNVAVWLYTDLLQVLKGDCVSSVFSPDGALISAYAASHCGGLVVKGSFQKVSGQTFTDILKFCCDLNLD